MYRLWWIFSQWLVSRRLKHWHQEHPCQIEGNKVHIPEFTVPSTVVYHPQRPVPGVDGIHYDPAIYGPLIRPEVHQWPEEWPDTIE